MKKKEYVVTDKQIKKLQHALELGLCHISYSSMLIRSAAEALDGKEPTLPLKEADKAYNALQNISDEFYDLVHKVK